MQKYEYRNMEEKYMKEAEVKAPRVPLFTSGVRVLFLLQRHKDGGHTNNSKLRMYITRDTAEWIDAYAKLLQEKDDYPEIALRIYQTLNARDIKKAVRTFKEKQLDNDYADEETFTNFYVDIKNRWVSSLMAPQNRVTSDFLIDVDTKEDATCTLVEKAINDLGLNIIGFYPSKKGYHYIVNPFNLTLFPKIDMVEVKKDPMMLLAF